MKVGDRVQTRDGPGELVAWERTESALIGRGWRRPRITYALVELDRGGRLLVQARDVRKAER